MSESSAAAATSAASAEIGLLKRAYRVIKADFEKSQSQLAAEKAAHALTLARAERAEQKLLELQQSVAANAQRAHATLRAHAAPSENAPSALPPAAAPSSSEGDGSSYDSGAAFADRLLSGVSLFSSALSTTIESVSEVAIPPSVQQQLDSHQEVVEAHEQLHRTAWLEIKELENALVAADAAARRERQALRMQVEEEENTLKQKRAEREARRQQRQLELAEANAGSPATAVDHAVAAPTAAADAATAAAAAAVSATTTTTDAPAPAAARPRLVAPPPPSRSAIDAAANDPSTSTHPHECDASYVLYLSELLSWRGASLAQHAGHITTTSFNHTPPPPATDAAAHPDAVAVRAILAELNTSTTVLRSTTRAFGDVRDSMERFVTGLLQPRALSAGADAVEEKVLHAQLATLSFVQPEQLGLPPDLCDGPRWSAAQVDLQRAAAFSCPLDIMRCVASACKHLSQQLETHDGAFVQFAALAVLQGKPPMLHSLLEYAARFVHADRLWDGELGGALSILRAAVQWLMVQDSATITMARVRNVGRF